MKTQNPLKSILGIAIIAVLLFTTSCDATNPPALAGIWSRESGGKIMILFKDGTGLIFARGRERSVFSWKAENELFAVLYGGYGSKADIFVYKISGSKLTLTDGRGDEDTYITKTAREILKE